MPWWVWPLAWLGVVLFIVTVFHLLVKGRGYYHPDEDDQ